MDVRFEAIIAMLVSTVVATSVSAQSASDIRGPSPLVAIEKEAPPRLIVDPPLPDQLASGRRGTGSMPAAKPWSWWVCRRDRTKC